MSKKNGLAFAGLLMGNSCIMSKTDTQKTQHVQHHVVKQHEPICQVVLHNDDVNSVEYVVNCLQIVFAYNISLAAKVMLEAHMRGRAIAEVEAESPALEHRDQLRSYGLSATVEPI